MLARARLAATPSNSSPIKKRNTTVAASSVAPMTTAPTAAIDISISIENGGPARAAEIARRPIGMRPTSIASRNVQRSVAGAALPIANAAAKATPDAMVSMPLRVAHQA